MWHPPALGLLAQRFPGRQGLFISLHRSTGNAGDWIGPLIVGALLGVVGWRWIIGGGTPLLLALAVAIFLLLRNVGGPRPEGVDYRARIREQLGAMAESFRGTGMWSIFTVSAVRGMGDRSLLWVIPLYLSQDLGMSGFWVSFHVSLLAFPGIVSGPLFGALSDRIGRKSIIVLIMATAVVMPLGMAAGGGGLLMSFSVLVYGLFLFSVNSLTQAAAIDVAKGKGLEGTFIGLMWGSNAFFGAISSVAAGALVEYFGWHSAFFFASGLFFVGLAASWLMPSG